VLRGGVVSPSRPLRDVRTPGMAQARRLYAAHAEAQRLGIPVQELLGAWDDSRRTRRRFLLEGGALIAGAALAARPSISLARRPRSHRIAIVGAGLAGVRCAHVLWTNPSRAVASTVYEANASRAGGRCWTLRKFFGGELVTEHGGAFINTTHTAVRQLAAGLGLQEEVINHGDLPAGEDIYWIDNAYYTPQQAAEDWSLVGFHAFRTARREMRSEAGETRLDSMSVNQWLDSTEIGSTSRLGKLLLANTVTENGGDPEDQSALDLIELVAANPRGAFKLLPTNDERFHIAGGNDQIVSRMIAQLPGGALQFGHELVALRQNSDRTLTLSFQTGAGVTDVSADVVVLALPFSTLRDVDLSRSGLSAAKRTVIEKLGMGTNAKIHVELKEKTWPALGFAGTAYGEWDSFCCAWDDSVPQGPRAKPALLMGFPGGRVGRTQLTGGAHEKAPEADVAWLLAGIEHVFPGTSAKYTGRAYEDHWAADPWVRGAYSYARVGQAATFVTIAAASEGPIHFAGEHTSNPFQGFMEGAVESGERVARRLLRRLGH
jgi:monoamine oxidase